MSAVKWNPKQTVPPKSGWYITRNDSGDLEWRAWGVGFFWKRALNSRRFCMNGRTPYFDWQPASWRTVRTPRSNLPAISLTSRYGRAPVPNLSSERRTRHLRQRNDHTITTALPLSERSRQGFRRYVIKDTATIEQKLKLK